MDNLTQLQNEYVYFTDMLKSIEKKKKKTPGNGFAKMKCKANNLKPNKFLKGTLEYQKKAFEKKDKADQWILMII